MSSTIASATEHFHAHGTVSICNHIIQRLGSIDDNVRPLLMNKGQICITLSRCFLGRHFLLTRPQRVHWSIQQDPESWPRHQTADQSRCPHRCPKSIPDRIDEEIVIIAITDEDCPSFLDKETGVPLFQKPDQYFDEGEKHSPRGFAMRVDHDAIRVIAKPWHRQLRLEVTSLDLITGRAQSFHQARDHGTFACSIWTKKDNFQFVMFPESSVVVLLNGLKSS